MRRFPCPAVPPVGTALALDGAVSHHILRVTRVPRGTRLALYDPQGNVGEGVLVDVQGQVAVVRVDTIRQGPPPLSPLWACLAVTKGPRFEVAIRMAIELGATAVVPVLAKRSVAKGDRHDRWARVMDGAVRQCGRAHAPVLHPLVRLSELLALHGPMQVSTRWVCVPGAAPVAGSLGSAAVLVGPEGGWSPSEVDAAVEAGWQRAGLGPTTLRAETAVAAALTRIRCGGPAVD